MVNEIIIVYCFRREAIGYFSLIINTREPDTAENALHTGTPP